MRLYSVMLVDEGNVVKEAISSVVDWEELGFEVVATVKSGTEALELAGKLKPDVVLTDFKTPFIDGLALCRNLKHLREETKVVIFSEYKEFEYMKAAIRIGAEDYMLKPIDADELRNVFLRIKKVLDKEIDNKRKLNRLQAYHEKDFSIIKDQLVMEILKGEVSDEQRVEEMDTEYELGLSASHYAAMVFQMDDKDKVRRDIIEKEQLAFSLKKIIDERLSEGFHIYSMVHLDMVVVIFLLENEDYLNRALREVNQLCKHVEEALDVCVTAGVGQTVETLIQLKESWRGAMDAVALRLFLGPNQAICISDIQLEISEDFELDEQIVSKLLMDIKIGEEDELQTDVEKLIGQFRNRKVSLYEYQLVTMEVIVGLLKLARSYHVSLEPFFGQRFDIYQEVQKFVSLDEVGQWLHELCLWLRTSIRRERKDSAKLMMDSAKQFIRENYSDSELSVKTLCSRLNVSATYFSTVFKRETGKSFVEYLTDVRLETAKELLNNTDDKTYVISAKVGYPESNYFSYVFKKRYGIAPSKYRADQKEIIESE